jgi:hypothetical protein
VGKGEREGKGGEGEKGGEMTQTLYAHMDKKKKEFQSKIEWLCCSGSEVGEYFMGLGEHVVEQADNQKRGMRGWGPTLPFKGIPAMIGRFPTRLHFLKFSPLPNNVTLETETLTHGPSEDVLDPTLTV